MSSLAHGDNTSTVEITNISSHGMWIYIRGKELFMSYEDFPWFKNQTVQAITHIEEFGESSFHWPEIDVDLTEEMIEFPERFPLRAKS
jgi:hypothetical protein